MRRPTQPFRARRGNRPLPSTQETVARRARKSDTLLAKTGADEVEFKED